MKRGQKWICGAKGCSKNIKTYSHIHHRDENPKNNEIGNLIALCTGCHQKVNHGKGKKKERLAKEILQKKPAIGGLVGHSVGAKIINSHFEGKITIKGNSKDVDVGGLVGRSENTEIVNNSADAEIEYKQV